MNTILFESRSREKLYPKDSILNQAGTVSIIFVLLILILFFLIDEPLLLLMTIPALPVIYLSNVSRKSWYIGFVNWNIFVIEESRIEMDRRRIPFNLIHKIFIRINYTGKPKGIDENNVLTITLNDGTKMDHYVEVKSDRDLKTFEKAVYYLKSKEVKVDFLSYC